MKLRVILIAILFSQLAFAIPVHYQWSYQKGPGPASWGNLTATGVDSSGYLIGISDVSMGLIGTGGYSTGYLVVENPEGWFFSEPRIRADGASVGLDFMFLSNYLGQEAAFVMHDHSEFGGPYEGEVSFMDRNEHFHMHENVSYSIKWNLWQTDAVRVPDGGSMVALSLLSLFPLMAAHCIRRMRKLV